MKINMTDKYQTRDGRPVRTLCIDKGGDEPVVALVGEAKTLHTYTRNGLLNSSYPCDSDLVPAPKECWINTYEKGCSEIYDSKVSADIGASKFYPRIACVKFKVGEGL